MNEYELKVKVYDEKLLLSLTSAGEVHVDEQGWARLRCCHPERYEEASLEALSEAASDLRDTLLRRAENYQTLLGICVSAIAELEGKYIQPSSTGETA